MFDAAPQVSERRHSAWLTRVNVMLAVMIALAVLSQFFRSSNGVIAPEMMAELNIDARSIGLSSGAFFVIFAVLQVPIGVLFDRYGARRVVSSMLGFAVVGSCLFALAQSLDLMVVSRFLIGLGFAGAMVGSLVVLSRWHNPTDFTRAMTYCSPPPISAACWRPRHWRPRTTGSAGGRPSLFSRP